MVRPSRFTIIHQGYKEKTPTSRTWFWCTCVVGAQEVNRLMTEASKFLPGEIEISEGSSRDFVKVDWLRTATFTPYCVDMREHRTPPLPHPIVNKSKSYLHPPPRFQLPTFRAFL